MADEPDTPRKRRFSFWRIIVSAIAYSWVVLLLSIIAAGAVAFLVYDNVVREGRPGPLVEVVIPPGVTGREVGKILENAGLLDRESFFRLAIRIDGANQIIRHGVYELPKGLSALQLLQLIYAGPDHSLTDDQIKITIPEGLSIAQTAALFPNPQAFVEACGNKDLIARIGISATSLEGFLMPDTYFFDKQPAEAAMVQRMVEQFEKNYRKLLEQMPEAGQYEKLKIVTVASLVEEEAKTPDERAKIAAVIYNRLDKKMPLQLDSTLQYALQKYGQRMLDQDKEADSPYNTYKHPGLPPAPIASPGMESLRAAMQPAKTNYLYFVSNADGKTHTFTTTLAEHRKAVARFRKEISQQRRELGQTQ
ncbi:MAG TPA: endolytic transglycosylase MltG [Candidatus Hydrogenedentes bacterium]|nr:endolytic transglycosylase MltG [Candidatus Hydrogenedentota bacterium]